MLEFSGAAKANGFRAIKDVPDGLEDAVDDATIVMDVPIEGGTEAMDDAQRFEAGMP